MIIRFLFLSDTWICCAECFLINLLRFSFRDFITTTRIYKLVMKSILTILWVIGWITNRQSLTNRPFLISMIIICCRHISFYRIHYLLCSIVTMTLWHLWIYLIGFTCRYLSCSNMRDWLCHLREIIYTWCCRINSLGWRSVGG